MSVDYMFVFLQNLYAEILSVVFIITITEYPRQVIYEEEETFLAHSVGDSGIWCLCWLSAGESPLSLLHHIVADYNAKSMCRSKHIAS